MLKLLGALIIGLCCGWFGFSLAASHRQEERQLRQLIYALDYMQCELQYRLTALSELCRQAGDACQQGAVHHFFHGLAGELEQQISPDPQICVEAALDKVRKMPPLCKSCIQQLGKSIGCFDLEGQISALESARQNCRKTLEEHCEGKEEQRRSYQTLGVCAGAALVILFI